MFGSSGRASDDGSEFDGLRGFRVEDLGYRVGPVSTWPRVYGSWRGFCCDDETMSWHRIGIHRAHACQNNLNSSWFYRGLL